MFDFSSFKASSERKIEFLGLTSDQTSLLTQQPHGLSKALIDAYPDIVMRGENPNSAMKCGIVWEANDRNCSYAEIAAQTGMSHESAYQQMSKFRKWVLVAFQLKVEHRGDVISIVTNETLAEKVERLNPQLQKAEKALMNLSSDVESLKQQGVVPMLPSSAAAILGAFDASRQLAAGADSVAA